jgi:hypothetical protein
MRPVALLTAVLLLAAPLPAAASGRLVLVELFTSQSCSSCPPAEALIGRLARENAQPGADVLPLAFHVTYWNHLDWRDPFALPAATARQAAYAARFGGSSYTPQAVIDGRTGLVGSDESGLRDAIARARTGDPGVPLALRRDGAGLTAQVGPGAGAGRLLLIGFDPSHVTRVSRGENAGRTIAQANVVRAVRDLGPWSGAAATLSAPAPEGETAAVILQADDGRILGAARLDAPVRAAAREGGR